MKSEKIQEAIDYINKANEIVVFTGAGISVESGIPPFRGENGLWSKYDPNLLDISYFYDHPEKCWETIKEMFYGFFSEAKPNLAHQAIAKLEEAGYVSTVITQNIDNLHYEAGNTDVIEFHGNSKKLVCIECNKKYDAKFTELEEFPPRCQNCGAILKPDFIFFREPIPSEALTRSIKLAKKSNNIWLVVGTTGLIYPAAQLPITAKLHKNVIIEVNIEPSSYTPNITDVFLEGKATKVLDTLVSELLTTNNQ
ncbi:MAG: NAD-dependent deacylase [Asgard group archaeon]|nr:NAD-dependent deacylase [Asgard group archaeon]